MSPKSPTPNPGKAAYEAIVIGPGHVEYPPADADPEQHMAAVGAFLRRYRAQGLAPVTDEGDMTRKHLMSRQAAEKLARELGELDGSGWGYEVSPDPEGTGKFYVQIFDEAGAPIAATTEVKHECTKC